MYVVLEKSSLRELYVENFEGIYFHMYLNISLDNSIIKYNIFPTSL